MADTLAHRLRATLTAQAESRLWTRSFLLICGTHLLAYSSYAAVNPTFAAYLDTVRGLPLGLLAGAALFGFGFALVFPLLQGVAISATRDDQNGSATATILIGMDIGIGIGAITFGVLADLVGFTVVYTGAALFSFSGLLVTILQRSN